MIYKITPTQSAAFKETFYISVCSADIIGIYESANILHSKLLKKFGYPARALRVEPLDVHAYQMRCMLLDDRRREYITRFNAKKVATSK